MGNGRKHVFISYSSKDEQIANTVCQILEDNKIKCWIAPRDIPLASDYATELVNGIKASGVFLLIVTPSSEVSDHVRNEVELATKYQIPKSGIIVDNYVMRGSLEYHFSRVQMAKIESPITPDKLNGVIKAFKNDSEIRTTEFGRLAKKTCVNNLPAPIHLIGRKKILEEIVLSLGKETQHYMILGMTGLGKKTLANNIAYRLMDEGFYDVIIWLTAQDGLLTYNSFLEQIAIIFDDQYMNRLEPEQREQEALNLLQKKAVLFVINGLHEIEDTRVLKLINRFTYDDAVLVTSDVNTYMFDNSKSITLKGLSKEEVRQLVKLEGERIGLSNLDQVPDKVIADLHRLSSGNPYVIKLSIGQIKAGFPFERILKGLEQARGRVFDDVFAKSWLVLTEEQKELLMLMALFRGSASAEALQKISNQDDWDLMDNVSRLINLSLVETNDAYLTSEIRYAILPLTRNFARKKLDESGFQHILTQSFMKFFSDYVAAYKNEYCALTAEIDNLRFMISWQKENDPPAHLRTIRNLYPFFRDNGHWDEAIENYSAIIARQPENNEIALEAAFSRCELVSIYIRRGGSEELALSDTHLDNALKTFTKLQDPKGLCAALGRKARVAQKRKDYKTALDFSMQALEIAQANELQSRIGDISHEMGDSYYYLGEYDKAEEYYSNALEIYIDLNKTVRTIGRYNDLGKLAAKMGNYQEARDFLAKSIDLAEEHKKLDTLCRAYINLAETLYHLEEYDLANENAHKGLDLAQKLRAHQEAKSAEEILVEVSKKMKE